MRQYLDLMRHVLEHGARKTDRTGTGTLATFGWQMRFDLDAGFPLVTTKKLHLQVDHPRAALVPARRDQRPLPARPRRHDLGRVGRRRRRARARLRRAVALVARRGRPHARPDRRRGGPAASATRTRAASSSTPGTSASSTAWRSRPATRCSSSTSPTAGSPASCTSAAPTSSSACPSTSPPTRCSRT